MVTLPSRPLEDAITAAKAAQAAGHRGHAGGDDGVAQVARCSITIGEMRFACRSPVSWLLRCAAYEAIDQRLPIERVVDEEVSLGDFVLSGERTAGDVR